MMSFSRRSMLHSIPALLVLVLGCHSDSTGPGASGLTPQQHTQLAVLLTNQSIVNAVLAGSPAQSYAATLLPLFASNIERLGTFTVSTANYQSGGTIVPPPQGDYSAFGGQFVITVRPASGAPFNLAWTGIIGVNDLANPTDVIAVGVIDQGATSAPSSISTTMVGSTGQRYALGSYIKLNAQGVTNFTGTTGQVSINDTNYGGEVSCPGAALLSFIKVCSYSSGVLQGSFVFTGELVGGNSTVSIPNTLVDLPSTRMTLSIDLSGRNAASSRR